MNIYAIQTGIVSVKSEFLRGSVKAGSLVRFFPALFRDTTFVDLPIYAWVIAHPEGVIVVDTGDVAETSSMFVTQSRFRIRPEEEIGTQLARLGIKVEAVSKVVLTHLHGDHINGLGYFQKTPIMISAAEYQELKSPAGRVLDRLVLHLPTWFAPTPIHFEDKPLHSFDKSFALTKAGDVIAVPTPGHTAGHLSVIVREQDRDVILAGDVTYAQAGLLAQEQQGLIMAPRQLTTTLQRMLAYTQATPSVYLPSHDPESGARLERREIVPITMRETAVA
jgi:N-acyl homoserine lactone hydrolase